MSEMTLQTLREKAGNIEPAVEAPVAPEVSAAPAASAESVAAPAAAASPVSTPAVIPQSSTGEPIVDVTAPVDVLPEWKPNVRFRAADQDHELPGWAQKAATKDNEKEIHEVFQKAIGLPQVKERLAKTSQEYQTFQGRVQELVGLRDKDLGKFFAKTGVTREKLAGWLREQADLETMTDDDRAVYNKNRELQEENERLSQALETDRSVFVEEAANNRRSEMDSVLANPQVSPVVKSYNERVGDENAFASLVIRHGQMAWNFEKRDLSATEAIAEVLTMIGHRPGATPSSATQPTAPASPTPKVINAPKPAVLPRVPNGTQSPTGSSVRRLSDLKERAKAFRDSR